MSFDLFSSIDFSFSKILILNVFVWFLSFMLVFNLFFLNSKSFLFSTLADLNNTLYKNLSVLNNRFVYLKWSLITMFEIIFLSNIMGLFPFVFGWTSHILIMFCFSLILWLSLNLSFLMFDSISFFSHLVPQGTPLVLGMFLSLIELMSNFMRPLTLSLRLGIKVTTGHILLGLMSMLGVQFSFKIFLVILASFYFLFELFVMFIQAIVYTLLISQYSEETLK